MALNDLWMSNSVPNYDVQDTLRINSELAKKRKASLMGNYGVPSGTAGLGEDQLAQYQNAYFDRGFRGGVSSNKDKIGTDYQINVRNKAGDTGDAWNGSTDAYKAYNSEDGGFAGNFAVNQGGIKDGLVEAAKYAAIVYGASQVPGLWGGETGSLAGAGEVVPGLSAPGYQSTVGLGEMSGVGAAPELGAISSPVTQGLVQGTALPQLGGGAGVDFLSGLVGGVPSVADAGVGAVGSLAQATPASAGSSALGIFGNSVGIDPSMIGSAMLSNPMSTLNTLSGLYSANQAGKANSQYTDAIQSQMQTLKEMFSQDSPYAKMLRQQLERKDAAAGRNSQYGNRETQLQALLAEKALGASSAMGGLAQQGATLEDANNSARNKQLFLLGELFKQSGGEDLIGGVWDWAKGGLGDLFG